MRRVCGHGTRLLRPQSTVSSTKALRPVAHNPCPTGAGQALTWDTSEGVHHRSIQRWQLGMYMLWLVSSAATLRARGLREAAGIQLDGKAGSGTYPRRSMCGRNSGVLQNAEHGLGPSTTTGAGTMPAARRNLLIHFGRQASMRARFKACARSAASACTVRRIAAAFRGCSRFILDRYTPSS